MQRFLLVGLFLVGCGQTVSVSAPDLDLEPEDVESALGSCSNAPLKKAIVWCDGRELSLVGLVSQAALTSYLATEDLLPVVPPGLPPGTALLILSTGVFPESNYGEYSDSFAATLVQRAGDPPGTADWFFFSMTNSNKKAQTISNAVWGFNLTAAESKMRYGNDKQTAHAFTTNEDGVISFFTMGRTVALTHKPQLVDAHAYTPVAVKQTKYPIHIDGTVYERPFDPTADSWFVRPDTALGQTLATLAFAPIAWNLALSNGKLSAPLP